MPRRPASSCVNLATYDLREEVNATSIVAAPGVDEAALVGLEMIPSVAVRPPRVKRSPVALECLYRTSVPLVEQRRRRASRDDRHRRGDRRAHRRLGDRGRQGRPCMLRPLSRLGYLDYGVIDTVFSMPRPQ